MHRRTAPPTPSPSRTTSDRHAADREHGFVLVWFALLIVVMLAVAAFAVDLGHAYLVGQQAQDAADAAALSAASYLPDNCPNADAHATAIAAANGFPNNANTTVTASNGSVGGPGCDNNTALSPNQIMVNVKTKVDTWFARAIGINTLTVQRMSTAEFDPPVELGSPVNTFGEAPGCAQCYQSNVWASVDGRANRKNDGNAISADWCVGQNNQSADNCSGSGLNNSDRDPNGMLFEISNPTLENLNVELFDPGYVDAGQPSGAQPYCNDPMKSTYPYCTGDTELTVTGNPPPLTTKYTLYPLDNLNDPLGDPPLCSVTYPGYASYAAAQTNPQGLNDKTFRSYHAWANLATDASGCGALNASSYVLQVQGGDATSGTPMGGSNMFSVAACSGCSPSQPTNDPNVSISAITKMSLFANVPAGQANPQFYLARVPSWAHGQVLTLSFFDVGDISNAAGQAIPGTLSVDAVDATHGAGGAPVGEFSNCTYSHPATRANNVSDYISGQVTPWGVNPPSTEWARNPSSLQSMGGGCTANVTLNPATNASFWNGKWVTWQIPIPNDYTCNDRDASKCWLQIKYGYGSAVFHDATTWTATLSGNPVRLTK